MSESADILVVSPDEKLRALLVKWLGQAGHQTWAGGNLAQCPDLIAELQPEIVLCDLKTSPAMGLKALYAMLGGQHHSRSRFVALLDRGGIGRIEAALEAGADDWIIWPCTRQALAARMEPHARVCRMREELEARSVESRALASQRERMISMFTHDLKSPLTVMMGHMQLLLRGKMGELPGEEAERALESGINSGNRLVNRIDDFLTVSGAMSCTEQMERREIDLRTLLECLADAHRAPMATRGLTLSLHVQEGIAQVEVDDMLLTRALDNLIDNATKYTPEGGEVHLGCEADGSLVRIWVRDTGMGVPADELTHIFDPFHRARHSARGTRGVGMGLAVVRTIAEAHGGEASVESEVGEGSCFAITLPLRVGGIQRRRALIIEDNVDFARLMALSLRIDGIDSTICETAEEALEKIAEQPPDLITLDLMLPGMPGWQFLKEIETVLDGEEVPILVLSASERRLRVVQSDSKVQVCMLKESFDQSAFREMARNLLGQR